MSWEKETPIEGGYGGHLCCGYQHDVLPMGEGGIIAVGLGYASLTKNQKEVYSENEVMANTPDDAEPDFMTFEQAEEMAAADPDNDWRIHLVAPLSERHYQRQGEKHWVLYKKGIGFA